MSLICGDIHGNYSKVKCFLEYKPEEEHIFTGDFMDSYHASDDEIVKTFKLFAESTAISVWGNHCLTYVKGCPSELMCSGHRNNPVFYHLANEFKGKFSGSIIRDSYIITHGGVSKGFGHKFEDIETMSNYINSEIDKVVNAKLSDGGPYGSPKLVIDRPLSDVFNIDFTRGGWHQYGGPLWADYTREKFDFRFNQIFGHTHRDKLKSWWVGKKEVARKFVAVDCDEFYCYDTKTGKKCDFMPKDYRKGGVLPKMLERRY